jgi:O-antigen/teichoic acid export membrane protein
MFDFGMGRATVRFVAGATVTDGRRLSEIVRASLFSQICMGTVAGAVLFALAPLLVNRVFGIASSSRPEAVAMFRVLALHIPVILGTTSLRASLEGAQRFDLSTALRVPSSIASVAVPAIGASLGASLATIMWLLLAVRGTLVVVSAAAVQHVLLTGGWRTRTSWDTLREMIRYSGWVAVSTALSPALASFERFVLGSIVGVGGLGFYTGASEAANRFLLIPATAFAALLPALSATDAQGERARSLRVTSAAMRQLAALLLPVCLLLLAFAPQILGAWLGPAFAQRSGNALRILAIGVFFGGLAHLPMALLYGSGRPDLPAKIHLCEVLVYIPTAFLLVRTWGITGAAMAWASRCTADFILYEIVSRRSVGKYALHVAERKRTRWLAADAFAFFVLTGIAAWLNRSTPILAIVLISLGCVSYAALSWTRVLSEDERNAWVGMALRFRARRRTPA